MSSGATESTRAIELLAWLEVNKKKLLAGVIALAVLAAALAIYRWQKSEGEVRADAALLALQKSGGRRETEPGPGAQAYLQVATAHAGTGAGARALLFGAEALFHEGKYNESKAEFEKFLRDYGSRPEAAIAAFGVAASLDAMDKTNEALTAYQDVVTRYGNSGVVGQARLAAARLYEEKNEPAQALKIYQELTRPTAQTVWASEAMLRREALLLKHPELVATNAPSGVPTPETTPSVTNLFQLTTSNAPPVRGPLPQ